ncbi:MAE_28990/MAE_18760 family HEPN-like nuclease [Microcoleus sp.]|uniref:MAE_28990/MAE_18760 family HEPN-like nuclease n=1 Tax=Microcoleus sp. TaxID=44472 RepID=UPI0035249B5C
MATDPTLLEQEIMSDISERRDLMFRLKALSPRYHFSPQDEALFLNYSIPIVYSIWEGFIQTSFQIYIRELNELNLKISDICYPILIYHIESEFPQFKQYPKKDKQNNKVIFFDKFGQFYQCNALRISSKVNTESNVGFNVLNRILTDFNLETILTHPEPNYSLQDDLDKFLLKIRNDVAHGQNSIVVHREDLDRAIKLVNRLMDLVFERIKTGFINKSYLR